MISRIQCLTLSMLLLISASAKAEDEITRLLHHANQGYARAQVELGYRYEHGKGVPQNDDKARKWYRMAAEKGDVDAQLRLDEMRFKALGAPEVLSEVLSVPVPQGNPKTAKWYRRAANQGDAYAQTVLGYLYLFGKHLDDVQGFTWLHKAAEQNYATAQQSLGQLYFGITASTFETKYGDDNDEANAEAVKWLHKAAEQGDSTSQFLIGAHYHGGSAGLPKNPNKAIEWYRKAADQGHSPAQYNLAQIYDPELRLHVNEDSVTKDRYKADDWYHKAADRGHRKAQVALVS